MRSKRLFDLGLEGRTALVRPCGNRSVHRPGNRQTNRGSERIGLGGTVEGRLLRVDGLGSSLSVAGIALGDDLERGSIDVLDSQP